MLQSTECSVLRNPLLEAALEGVPEIDEKLAARASHDDLFLLSDACPAALDPSRRSPRSTLTTGCTTRKAKVI